MIFKIYQTCLNRFPLFSQALQTSILMGTGDALSQIAVEKKTWSEYNVKRTGQFAAIGFFLVGPTLTTWYGFLAKRFDGGRAVALKKVACDQLLFAPCFIVVFLSTLGLVQDNSPKEVTSNIKRDYKDILISNYQLWPAVQLMNFYIVPLKYQVLLVQCVALSWNTYLSWKTQNSAKNVIEESVN